MNSTRRLCAWLPKPLNLLTSGKAAFSLKITLFDFYSIPTLA
jgi:hypothetical protein